jgi:hypothetical protein
MTKTLVSLFLVLMTLGLHAQSVIQRPSCTGLIRGFVFDQSGNRVSGIRVKAWPIGVGVSGTLPSVETDKEGTYRFERVCPGRYTVLVEDGKAGYPSAGPMLNAFLYGAPVPEAILTVKNPQADLPVYLPPKPGLMQVHIINQETKVEVGNFRVMLKVPGQQDESKMEFIFDDITVRQIEVPPDKDVIYHVTAEGFHEWGESAGEGKVIRLASGAKATLEAELER